VLLRLDELSLAPLRGPRQPVAGPPRPPPARRAPLAQFGRAAGGAAGFRGHLRALRRASARYGDLLGAALARAGSDPLRGGRSSAREPGAHGRRTALRPRTVAAGARSRHPRTP